jgi:hypothetical protein
MSRPGRSAVAMIAGLAIVGCGGTTHVPAPPTLPPHAVPYLPSSAKALSAAGLAREAQSPSLSRRLSDWGFVAGSDRYFQGESHQLQVVDSRTFRFESAAGAASFVGFIGRHAAAYLGSFPRMGGLRSRGRRGILATAQPCQCHLANPAYLGVVTRGGIVTWLEINGPAATPRRLAELIAAAP